MIYDLFLLNFKFMLFSLFLKVYSYFVFSLLTLQLTLFFGQLLRVSNLAFLPVLGIEVRKKMLEFQNGAGLSGSYTDTILGPNWNYSQNTEKPSRIIN